jgi:chromosome segregation protein
MYLKRLELRGFKTFATHTDFQFDEGITAIVGPNGSGKSNIADAVRWVLGEQSYSVLRGRRTEDMIFAGTRRRPRVGMAEAVMTFDNSSGWLPIDFTEVTIGRRAYRSGENRYLMNGSRVRLRDITELIGKAGLGRHGLVTIGQGVADAALSLRPEERRVLFEEAAGIRVYQEKRSDALGKLAETEQNLLRLADILHEIRPRLRDLQRQAQKTEEHELLSRDLEKLLRIWYGYRWRRLQAQLGEAEAALHRRQADVEMARARMHELEALLTNTHEQQSALRRQLSMWHTQTGDLHTQAEEAMRELAVGRERWGLLQQRHVELATELEGLCERRTSLQDRLSATQTERERLQRRVQTLGARLQELREAWQREEEDATIAQQRVEEERSQAFQLATALAEARNRSAQLQERVTQLIAERERGQTELQEAAEQLPALQRDTSQLLARNEGLGQSQEEQTALTHHLRHQLTELDEEWKRRREELAKASHRVQRLRDRQEMLQGMRQSLSGYTPGAKAVLAARQGLRGVVRPVASVLRVPHQLEQAVEAALGPYAQAIVMERWEDAHAAIADLHKRTAGWATFLPLDSLAPPQPGVAPAADGVIGLAQNLIEYDARYEPVARLLLGRVIIVQDLDTAWRIRSQLQVGQRLVTLSGEVVQATGVISGGSEHGGGAVLAQEREWRELPDQMRVAEQEQQTAQGELKETEERQQATRQQLAEALEQQQLLSQESGSTARQLAQLQAAEERLRQEIEWRRRVDQQQESELAALDERKQTLHDQIKQLCQEQDQRQTHLEGAIAQLDGARQAEELARRDLTEAETELAVTQRQLKVQDQLLGTQSSTFTSAEQEITLKSERMRAIQQESSELSQRIERLQAQANSYTTQIAQLAGQIEPAEAEVLASERQAAGLEEGLTQARRRLNELEVLFNQQLLERERRSDALQTLEQRIEEELGDIEYPSERARQLRLDFFRRDRHVLPPLEVLPENLQADIKELKGHLRRLGSVNPNAPQEYHEVSERYEFLQSQMHDLEESAGSLQSVIAELDKVMEAEFLSIFSVAAEQFSSYFEALFGGGYARLILTEPGNPATSGVDIVARPPGKRQQSLALLSGGERALTATALLFAVLRARPLPFCLLDEVDAMLDEANVGRFRSILEQFARQTQFIVITHNRQTIQAANTIYGVSMEEEGVSKVISLRLEGEDMRDPD